MRNYNNSILIKSTVWYTISNFLTRAIVFITTPLFARLLSTEEFGNFHVFANWQIIFIIICGMELPATLNRAKLDYTDGRTLGSYITSCLLLSTSITSLIFAFFILFPHILGSLLMIKREYMYIMFIYLFTYPAFEMFQMKQRIRYNYKLSASISFITVSVSAVLSLIFAKYCFSDHLMGRIVGQYMPYAIIGLVLYIYFFLSHRSIRLSYYSYAFKIALPLVVSYLGSQLLLSSDKLVVQHYASATAVAYVGIATTCGHIISIFVQCLNIGWTTWFYDKIHEDNYQSIESMLLMFLSFITLCIFGVIMIGPELVFVLGGEKYAEALWLIPANMVTGFFIFLSNQYVNYETYFKKTYIPMGITFGVAVLNIIFDIIGTKSIGYYTVCYVTVFSYLLIIVLHSVAIKIIRKRSFISSGMIIGFSVVNLLFIPLGLFVYGHQILRISLLSVVIIVLLILFLNKRKELVSFIKG